MTSADDIASCLAAATGGITIQVKVVPGAKRSKLVGVLGDRLKITVAAPPEDGKANRAVCALLADVLGLPARDVTVTQGPARPQKTLEAAGITLCAAAERLRSALGEA